MTEERNRLDFVGLGLYGPEGMGLDALSVLRKADIIFAEFYTSFLGGATLADLEECFQKKITLLTRDQVESESLIIDAAKDNRVVFLTAGDSMSATTHVELRMSASKMNIPTRIYHAPSVLTAVPSELGLSHYKFGRTTTLVFPRTNFFPTSPYDVIERNLASGFHTLVLLDIVAERSGDSSDISAEYPAMEVSYNDEVFLLMPARTGFELLLDMERKLGREILSPGTLVCAVARAGAEDVAATAGYLEDMRYLDMGPPLHSIVIPGKLHFMEGEALVELANAPREILDKLE